MQNTPLMQQMIEDIAESQDGGFGLGQKAFEIMKAYDEFDNEGGFEIQRGTTIGEIIHAVLGHRIHAAEKHSDLVDDLKYLESQFRAARHAIQQRFGLPH